MYNKKLKQHFISEKDSVYKAYWRYKHNKNKILIVLDNNNDFSGVITANEINKIKSRSKALVSEIVNKRCKSVQFNDNKESMDKDLRDIFSVSKNINCIPILQGKKVIDICTRKNYKDKPNKKSTACKIKGNYELYIKSIVNEYLIANYNLSIEKFDNLIKNYLVNYKAIFEKEIDSMTFYFEDSVASCTVDSVTAELNQFDEYRFKDIDFKEGDIVIDIGGNIGMVSIYLAKKFPFLKIYAYEPVVQNYESFLHNIKLNNIPDGTIIVENKAVTGNGRDISMLINPTNSGGCAISDIIEDGYIFQEKNSKIKSTTLDEIFKTHNIKDLRLLKLDCEGSEYEIMQNTDVNTLKKIKSLRGEFHSNKGVKGKYNIKKLYNYVSKYIKDVNVCKCDLYPVLFK